MSQRRGYANRPSQSDQEFVINSSGERVRNMAYDGGSSRRANYYTDHYFNNDISSEYSYHDSISEGEVADAVYEAYENSGDYSFSSFCNDVIKRFDEGENIGTTIEVGGNEMKVVDAKPESEDNGTTVYFILESNENGELRHWKVPGYYNDGLLEMEFDYEDVYEVERNPRKYREKVIESDNPVDAHHIEKAFPVADYDRMYEEGYDTMDYIVGTGDTTVHEDWDGNTVQFLSAGRNDTDGEYYAYFKYNNEYVRVKRIQDGYYSNKTEHIERRPEWSPVE